MTDGIFVPFCWQRRCGMAIRILSVDSGSLAEGAGFHAGDTILRINGEEIIDEIDYQALSIKRSVTVDLAEPDGKEKTIRLAKKTGRGLGLHLDERAVLSPRVCRNHCIFCFVDQLPKGLRPTLYVRDDDWRLSLMMGNFVTLTNVDDAEFERILRRKASPLYISVHATDPSVRCRMLRNPSAGNLLPRLKQMADAGIKFHCQVVLCPEINDGSILHKTIVDLAALHPYAQSLAIVPIGLTGHREGLDTLRLLTKGEARALLRDLELIQAYYLRTIGTRFVYPADELYSIAGLPVPPEETYEGYPQIENGIGMLRLLAQECEEAWPAMQNQSVAPASPRHLLIPTGVSAEPYIRELTAKYAPPGVQIDVFPVVNRFFGPSVTVTGLIVGRDLTEALKGRNADQVLISCSMLRENGDCFLDDMTLSQVQEAVGLPIRVVKNSGKAFLDALYGLE